jgi:anti-sigma regulatory factor (Ser/Thr protein kinase)
MADDERVGHEAWHLPPTARSVPQARRHIASTLGQWHLTGLTETACLLVSELVTNAVLHARTAMTLTATKDGDGVRISVTDGSPVPPALRRHSDTATTGRGLRLLDQLADAWSVESSNDGKSVWFTLSTSRDPWQSMAGPHWLAEAEA